MTLRTNVSRWRYAIAHATGRREVEIPDELPALVTQERARLTGRAKSNLSRTLKIMEGYGLVHLDKRERRRIIPCVNHDRVELDLALTRPRLVDRKRGAA